MFLHTVLDPCSSTSNTIRSITTSTSAEKDKARLPVVQLFDVLVNNADRKGSHVVMETGTRKLWAIDHGLCFHEEDKLRTVIWDSAGHAIPEGLLASLAMVPSQLEVGAPLRLDLRPYLSTAEIEAMLKRVRGPAA